MRKFQSIWIVWLSLRFVLPLVQGKTIINNCVELQNMQNNLTEAYELGANIDCSETVNWNRSLGFEPIGNRTHPFVGTLDGRGYSITNLFIYRPMSETIGLLGWTGLNAVITSISLIDIEIVGLRYVGGLVGYNAGTINHVIVMSNVSGGPDSSFLGGLVGWNENTIHNASAMGSVSSDCDSGALGGLVGYNEGTINNATATSDVSGNGKSACLGGLVGRTYTYTATINHATTTGSVSGDGDTAQLGGLMGCNEGIINNTTSMSRVSANGDNADVGGLVGWNGGTLNQTAAIGSVSSDGDNAYVGGLVGRNEGTINNTTATGSVSNDGDRTDVGGLVGFNQITGIIRSANATGDVVGRQNVGGLVGQNDGSILYATATGTVSGTSNSFNVGGFVGINNGKILSANAIGLVLGNNHLGGLVGLNTGAIYLARATGDVFGNNFVGGLIGENEGTISTAYATGSTTGMDSVGGLIGLNSGGSIQNVYATGGATGESNVAGLIGFISNTSAIAYAVASGCVQGSYFTSGLIGQWLIPPNMTSIYWDADMMEHSQLPNDMAYLEKSPYKRTTKELYRQSTYDNWNFNSIWRINERHSYPYFSMLMPEVIPTDPPNPCYTTPDLFGLLLKTLFTPLIAGLTLLLVAEFFIRQQINTLTFRYGNLDVSKALPALARAGQLSAMKCICDDISISPSDDDVCSALRFSALSGHLTIACYLLEKYSSLFGEELRSSIAEEAYLRNYPHIADQLVADYSKTQGTLSLQDSQTQLSQVLKNYSYPWLSTLRLGMQGLFVNILYKTDSTPLMLAVQKEQFNTALFMIYFYGADVMMTNSKGKTVVDQLTQQRKITQARQFIEIDTKTSEDWHLAFSVICQLISEGKMTSVNLSRWLMEDESQNPRTSKTKTQIRTSTSRPPSQQRMETPTTKPFPVLTYIQVWIVVSFCVDMLNRLADLYLIHTLRNHEQLKLANASLICFLIAYTLDGYGFRTALGYWCIPLDTNGLWQIVMLPVANPGLVRLTWGVDLIDLHLAGLKLIHFCFQDIAQWAIIVVFYIQAKTFPSMIWMKVIISTLTTLLWIIWFLRFRSVFQQQRRNQGQRRSRTVNDQHEERNSVTMRLLADANNE